MMKGTQHHTAHEHTSTDNQENASSLTILHSHQGIRSKQALSISADGGGPQLQ